MQPIQARALAGVPAFHDFTFTDRLRESGITFRNRSVDDAGRTYKAAHYDHGNGLAVADVDGDGRLNVYFVSQVGGNQLWRNIGGGRFEDITASAGVAVPGRISVTASFADIDNDGDADLYVTTVRGGNVLFENQGNGRFRDISAESGLNYTGHSSGAVFFDYDRDGRLDLLLLNVGKYTTETLAGDAPYRSTSRSTTPSHGHLMPERAERSLLFHNEGNDRFTDVTDQMGLTGSFWSGDASVVDVNDDGWPDLYVLNMQGDDQYFENDHGRRFVNRSREQFPRTSWGSMGIKVFDFNNDGRQDILVTDMHSDMSHEVDFDQEKKKSDMQWPMTFRGDGSTSIWGNSLFEKDGAGTYREVSDPIGVENYCPWGPSVGDLNADGFDDIFIASGMNYPYRYEINSVKLNDGGRRFVDAEFALGVEPRSGGLAAPWFRLDASGKDRGPQGCRRPERRSRDLGRARFTVRRHLRRRRRRRPRHRHQRVQHGADDPHQQPRRADAGSLPRGEAGGYDVESRRPRRSRQGHGRRQRRTRRSWTAIPGTCRTACARSTSAWDPPTPSIASRWHGRRGRSSSSPLRLR